MTARIKILGFDYFFSTQLYKLCLKAKKLPLKMFAGTVGNERFFKSRIQALLCESFAKF